MHILLATLNSKYIHSNLAIRLLYQLNKEHEGLAWKEFTIKEPKNEIVDFCKDFQLVAFSVYIWNITPTLEVCKMIKEANPDIQIMLGGPEVSYEYESVIAQDCVDYIVVGEGEIPFSRFIQSFPTPGVIPGIVSKQNGQIIYLPCTEDFDLKQLEPVNPYGDDVSAELKNKVLYIETSRGCPYKCEFCLASLDNKVRNLSMSRIKENLMFLMLHGRVIKFLDRTFNVKKDFTIEVFQFILDHHQPGNIFQFEITADILHPHIIDFIQRKVPKGLFRFEIGIQTVNQKANLEVSRKQNFYKTKGVIEQIQDKIEMHLDLIVGLPFDYWADIKFSIEEVFKIFPPELQLGFLKFLKGTPVREKYRQHHYVFDPEPPYQIIQSDYLTKEELFQITQLEFALEAYWNKKRLVHTLKYICLHYSIFDFLLGLGIYFAQKSNYHRHTLQDLYIIAFDFILIHYPDDLVLQQIFGIDYYLQHKIKPKPLFITEMERYRRNEVIEKSKLNHHKNRYAIFELDFDFEKFVLHQQIVNKKEAIVVEYSNNQQARIFTVHPSKLLHKPV